MMKAIATQNGKLFITKIEKPRPARGQVLVRNEYSAISPGTEMSFVKRAANQLVILGYSSVGIIEELGEGVGNLQIGQRVSCYGAPYVNHGQWLSVPTNLTAIVPDTVDPQEAAFAGLGAIAIHALRIAELQFGESAIIVGLGILGHMIAQISHQAAYVTAGFDLNTERVNRLIKRGLPYVYDNQEQLTADLKTITSGFGADAVLLCASGSGEQLINSSLGWIRQRGKIVIVGDLTTEFSRTQMFGKEAQILISQAGGPGRYDLQYEKHNIDYPIGFVRWTEGRNIGEYIRLLEERRITVRPLITDTYEFDDAPAAYEKYRQSASVMGTVIKYDH